MSFFQNDACMHFFKRAKNSLNLKKKSGILSLKPKLLLVTCPSSAEMKENSSVNSLSFLCSVFSFSSHISFQVSVAFILHFSPYLFSLSLGNCANSGKQEGPTIFIFFPKKYLLKNSPETMPTSHPIY